MRQHEQPMLLVKKAADDEGLCRSFPVALTTAQPC